MAMSYIVLEMGGDTAADWKQVEDDGLLPSEHTYGISAYIRTGCRSFGSYLFIYFAHFSPFDLNILNHHLIACVQCS